MRRVAAIIGILGVGALLVVGQAAGGSGGDYEVRAIFDNGNFLVAGEEVRVAGAAVGSVSSVDVTMPGDWTNAVCSTDPTSRACSTPGKAVVVMKITDPGLQDFRQDASCLIRPQSLLGEKYIDCTPTQPRAPGSQPPPPLATIPSDQDQPGAGQHFLPVQNNAEEVDLDLVNNIMREPYADRFRLILNSLGAGLAARGKTLDAIIKRADPALRQTDRVLAILAGQNRQLAQLAKNGDTIMAPLARERSHLAGFINNANTAGEATAERSQDLEAGFAKFPAALHQLKLQMAQLKNFSDQATPVFTEFHAGAKAITRSTKALGPFAQAARPALTSLGTAAAESKKPLVNSDPILVKIRDLAKKAAPGTKSLGKLLTSFRKTDGSKFLMHFFFYTTGGVNGFDQYGHFLRAGAIVPPSCTYLTTGVFAGCSAKWGESPGKRSTATPTGTGNIAAAAVAGGLAQGKGGTPATKAGNAGSGGLQPGQPLDAQGEPPAGTTTTTTTPTTTTTSPTTTTTTTAPASPRASGGGSSLRAARDLLDTVIGRPHHHHRHGRAQRQGGKR
jgi:phospholipid/cholesterol/gamma-HCH transport system substrate-binding protein